MGLYLQNNRLTGPIPLGLGNRPGIRNINLSNNSFTGAIPDTLGDIKDLRILDLSNNQLAGELPSRLGNLSNLTHLLVNDNASLGGSIPWNFTRLTNLIFFSFDGTRVCQPRTGVVPQWLSQIPTADSGWICDWTTETTREEVFEYTLDSNYPNPFNPTTMIRYTLPRATEVRLEVFNVIGERVRVLESRTRPAGEYEVSFNATGLGSGIYFYTLRAGDFEATRKMVLLR